MQKKKKGFDELFDRQSKWDEELFLAASHSNESGHFCQEFFLTK